MGTDQNNMCEHSVSKKGTQEAKPIIEPNKRQCRFIQHQSSEWTAAILSALNLE